MSSIKMRQLKDGDAILWKNEIWVIVERHEQTQGNIRTYWQVKLKNLEKGNVVRNRFAPDDNVERVDLYREIYEYLYEEGTSFVFMHPESFEQLYVAKDRVPEEYHGYLVPNMRLNLLRNEEKVVSVEMPSSVEAEVVDAPDAARGDTATAVTKLVKIETGKEIRVPAHIKNGDRIKIRIEDGEFIGRAN